MNLTATEAKNKFGQVLEQAQSQPVFIDKAGRRHSVVISAAHYEAMLVAAGGACSAVDASEPRHPEARRFYEQYKEWVDEQNAHHERYGIWNEPFRSW